MQSEKTLKAEDIYGLQAFSDEISRIQEVQEQFKSVHQNIVDILAKKRTKFYIESMLIYIY